MFIPFLEPSGYPSNLRIISIVHLTVTFQWSKLECDKQNGPLSGYEYRLHTNSRQVTDVVDPDVTAHSVLVEKPGIVAFSVAAVNSVGVGPHSPPVEALLGQSSPSVLVMSENLGMPSLCFIPQPSMFLINSHSFSSISSWTG